MYETLFEALQALVTEFPGDETIRLIVATRYSCEFEIDVPEGVIMRVTYTLVGAGRVQEDR